MDDAEANRLLEEMAARLGEHFDAVQILVSWNEYGLTNCAKRGVGNWYARQGMAQEFIDQDQAQTLAREVSLSQLRDDPDDDDD